MSRPIFSIVITTYNHENYISDAIKTALNQDFDNFEVIISNDCSTDDTHNVIKKYTPDERLKYYYQSKNIGRVKNYRKCLYEYVKGKWVVYCDGDDFFIRNDFLSDAYKYISENKDLVAIQAGKLKGEDLKTAVLYKHNLKDDHSIITFSKFLRKSDELVFSHLNTLYNVDLAKNIDFYRKDILSSDKESIYRLLPHGKLLLLKTAYGLWRKHDTNATLIAGFSERLDNMVWINSCFWYFIFNSKNPFHVIRWYYNVKSKNLKFFLSFSFVKVIRHNQFGFLKNTIKRLAIQDWFIFLLNPHFYFLLIKSIKYKL